MMIADLTVNRSIACHWWWFNGICERLFLHDDQYRCVSSNVCGQGRKEVTSLANVLKIKYCTISIVFGPALSIVATYWKHLDGEHHMFKRINWIDWRQVWARNGIFVIQFIESFVEKLNSDFGWNFLYVFLLFGIDFPMCMWVCAANSYNIDTSDANYNNSRRENANNRSFIQLN